MLEVSSTMVVEKPGIADNRSGLQGFQSTNPNYFTLVWWRWLPTLPHYFGTWLLISTGKFGIFGSLIVFGCGFSMTWKIPEPICWAGSCQSCPRASRRYAHRHPYARRMRRVSPTVAPGGWWNDDISNGAVVVWLFYVMLISFVLWDHTTSGVYKWRIMLYIIYFYYTAIWLYTYIWSSILYDGF